MLSLNISQNILGLSNLTIKNIFIIEDTTNFEVEMVRKPHKCPCCGTMTNRIHDYRLQKVKDLPSFGNNVNLLLRKRRYVCPSCNKRFYEKIDFLPKYHRMTSRVINEVLMLLASTHSFKSVAKQLNLSPSTVVRIFDHLSYQPSQLPRVIAFDEFKGNAGSEKYQCIITDPEHHKIIDILPNRYKVDLISYLLKFDTSHTELFISDMWPTYRDLAKEIFPDACYIIDKYHYVRQVIWALEAVRKEVQKEFSDYRRKYFKRSKSLLIRHFDSLDTEGKQAVNMMLYTSPKLASAHSLKEEFFRIMKSKNRSEALQSLAAWITHAENSNLPRFVTVALTLNNWLTGIINSFETPYTNGFTEGTNNTIKVLKRNAYGYRNFKRFRNRILHLDHLKSR